MLVENTRAFGNAAIELERRPSILGLCSDEPEIYICIVSTKLMGSILPSRNRST